MRTSITVVILALSLVVGGCAKRQTPVATPQPAPPAAQPPQIATANPAPPRRVDEALPVPAQPAVSDDAASSRSIDDLNRNSPLKPVFFSVDSADLDETARAVASANADVLKKNSSWVITIEGHCDERGTAEYNLALGERRAIAVKTFLVSLGISPDRVRTISYGKEFPFDPGKTEEAFYRNRRGHFVITSN
ncbi:MAG TPA: OmpA family protein [Vicinamibacterales bacterium]|jgi:peptidoglycan-associated lipoprotein|nr:OmpA family protein [Vicinamibacterales bacterium]